MFYNTRIKYYVRMYEHRKRYLIKSITAKVEKRYYKEGHRSICCNIDLRLQETCSTVSLENKTRKRETKCNSFSSESRKPVTENVYLRIPWRYVLMISFVVTFGSKKTVMRIMPLERKIHFRLSWKYYQRE